MQRFHQERKTKLSLILDSERWKQADVPEEFQCLVTHISDTGKLCRLLFRKWYQTIHAYLEVEKLFCKSCFGLE